MSNFNLNLFNNSKTVLTIQNKAFDLIIKDIVSEIEYLKSRSIENAKEIESIEKEKKDNNQDVSYKYETNDTDIKNYILEKRQYNAERETDIIGDEKTRHEQYLLNFKNLLRKSKQIIESIESKIESPDDDEKTDDDIKNELIAFSNEIKQSLDDFPIEFDFNLVNKLIKNKYEAKGIDYTGVLY